MLQRIRRLRRNEKGFSLIEVSMVSVTLGSLAAIAIFSVSDSTPRAETTSCAVDVRNVRLAEEAYFLQNDAYSATTAELLSSGMLKNEPPEGEVAITLITGPPAGVSVSGSSDSDCSDFSA